MAVDTGHNANVTFATTGGTWYLQDISGGPELTLPVVDKTFLNSATRRRKMPGDVAEVSPVVFKIFFQGSQGLPSLGTVENCTITHPTASGNSSPASLVMSGFIARVRYPDFRLNEMQMGEIEFQPDGDTLTYTAAS